MIHIDLRDVHKSFGGQSVLRGLSFSVTAGEHIGIVGPNGAGKTTLLRLLTGAETPDSGAVSIPGGLRVGLLGQLPSHPEGVTALDVLRQAFARFTEAEAELRRMEAGMSSARPGDQLVRRYGELAHRYEVMGGFETEVELARVCSGLGFTQDFQRRHMSKLSGGEQTRVNLARLLLERTDILLLDEPTNHLDLRACEWLEEYLGTFKGTVLAVSHDRRFLDAAARRVIEIDGGKAEFYSGNYSFYAAEREARRLEALRRYEKETEAYEKLASAARQMHAWAGQNAKLHRRAFAMEKRAERIRTASKPVSAKTMRSGFGESEFKADDIFRLQGLSKSFGDNVIFDDLTLSMRKGERIALLGSNGAGKTTLLTILAGSLEADSGRVWRAPSLKAGYLPQKVTFARPDRSLLDTMLYELDISPAEARGRLAAFLFTGDKVFDHVGALSGGELSRLTLCILMARSVSLLLLDEPTNHLDIGAREWMEGALEEYSQAMLFVSHDRYFVERFADRVWWLENGVLRDFPGGYAGFRAAFDGGAAQKPAQSRETVKPPKPAGKMSPSAMRRGLEQALARLETDIGRVESRLNEADAEISREASNYESLCALLETREALNAEREALYERYQQIAAELEA
ncbi:MAG: ABC-F family ATP-binding cassette domain-containing protein [Oscillospiraceae bacterium]|nr:ABC-F family ATP-binding cassette domain-containing protein [Oscillospiraceae bacterium]